MLSNVKRRVLGLLSFFFFFFQLINKFSIHYINYSIFFLCFSFNMLNNFYFFLSGKNIYYTVFFN